jgi:hypothetical protein
MLPLPEINPAAIRQEPRQCGFPQITGISCGVRPFCCAKTIAREYSSLTQPDCMDSGETISATALLCANPFSSAPTKRSPGRISSRSSQQSGPFPPARFLACVHWYYGPLGLPPGSVRFQPSGLIRPVFARLGCQVGLSCSIALSQRATPETPE